MKSIKSKLLHIFIVSPVQTSKNTKIVRDPNLRLKMSEYNNSSNNSVLRPLFPTKAILKLLFVQLQSIIKTISLIFNKKIGLIVQSDGLCNYNYNNYIDKCSIYNKLKHIPLFCIPKVHIHHQMSLKIITYPYFI